MPGLHLLLEQERFSRRNSENYVPPAGINYALGPSSRSARLRAAEVTSYLISERLRFAHRDRCQQIIWDWEARINQENVTP